MLVASKQTTGSNTMNTNQIVSARIAIVNGERTALAGCSNIACTQNCLRKSDTLSCKSDHNRHNNKDCRYIIAA